MRSTSITGEGLDRLPVFFHQCTLHTNMLRTNQERYRRRVTFTVGTKVSQSLKFHHFSTNDRAEFTSYVRISLSTSNFLLPAYTVRKRAPHRTRKTVAARDLQCQCQGQNLKFRHFSTNHRAEFPSNIRISGTNSYFLFTGVHYTKLSSRPPKTSCVVWRTVLCSVRR